MPEWVVIYKAIADFSDLTRKAAEALAELEALKKAAKDLGDTQILYGPKIVAAREADVAALKNEASAMDAVISRAPLYDRWVYWKGANSYEQYLANMQREQQLTRLLNIERQRGFYSPYQDYAWRNQELAQMYLWNRAIQQGYATPEQYLSYLNLLRSNMQLENQAWRDRDAALSAATAAALNYANAIHGTHQSAEQLGLTTTAAQGALTALSSQVVSPTAQLSDSQLRGAVLLDENMLTQLGEMVAQPRVELQDDAGNSLTALQALIASMGRERVNIQVGAPTSDLRSGPMTGGANVGAGPPDNAAAAYAADAAAAKADAAAQKELAGSENDARQAMMNLIATLIAAKAAQAGTAASADSAGASVAAAAAKTKDANSNVAAAAPLWYGWGTAIGGLTGKLVLFGGAFGTIPVLGAIAGWHLLIEAILEFGATLLGAGVALGAFAAAAYTDFQDIFKQMQSLYTVTQAYGVSLGPFKGQLQAVAQAIQPNVYVLFGEALDIINKKSGAFTTLAEQAAKVMDDLGARFTNAITQGSGFNKFLQNAAGDLSGWGNLIGNIGGIIGNVLKVLPGYAEIILSALGDVTHAIEVVTASPLAQWFLDVGLKAHGAIIWIGLLGTAFTVLMTKGLAGLASTLLNVGVGLEKIGATAAANAMGSFAASAEAAAGLPWGWIGVVAAAIGFLVIKLLTAKDALQQFFDTEQKNLQNAPLTNLASTLNAYYSQASASLKVAQADLRNFEQANAAVLNGLKGTRDEGLTPVVRTLEQLQQNVSDYAAGVKQLQGDQDTLNGHMAQATKVFGSTSAAWAALNAAGITSAQLLDKNSTHWAEAMIEAEAYNAAIQALTQSAGRYGAAQNALNFAAGDSANALGQSFADLQSVTNAEDALLNAVISSEQNIVTFEQAVQQMGTDASVAGAHLGSLTDATGHLSGASLKLSADFYSTAIPAFQKLIDSMQQQQANTTDLTTVTATGAGQMLKYAGNNIAARATIVDLINNALGPGTVSLQNLNKWVGANATSLDGMQRIIDKVTGSASKLAGVLQSSLNQMLAQAATSALGGQKALNQFAQAVINGDTNAQDLVNNGGAHVLAMFEQMYQNDIPRAKNAFIDWAKNGLGLSQQNAMNLWNQLITLQGQIDKMHGTNIPITVTGEGAGGVQITASGLAASGPGNVKFTSLAGGGMGYVAGGSGSPVADDFIARLSTGEFVVQAASTAKYGVAAMQAVNSGRAKISYASGGLATIGPDLLGIPGLIGDYYGPDAMADMADAVHAMLEAIKAAIAAAAKSSSSSTTGTGGVRITNAALGGLLGYMEGGPTIPLGPVPGAVAGATAVPMAPGFASGGWAYPAPSGLSAYDIAQTGYRLKWNPVHGPSNQVPNSYTIQTWQLNGVKADEFVTNPGWTNTAEYGWGGRGLHPGWQYKTLVWANGGPDAPPHAQMIVALQNAVAAGGSGGSGSSGSGSSSSSSDTSSSSSDTSSSSPTPVAATPPNPALNYPAIVGPGSVMTTPNDFAPLPSIFSMIYGGPGQTPYDFAPQMAWGGLVGGAMPDMSWGVDDTTPTARALARIGYGPSGRRSAAADATGSGGQYVSVTFGDINNPRPEPASVSITHATQKAAFLAGRILE